MRRRHIENIAQRLIVPILLLAFCLYTTHTTINVSLTGVKPMIVTEDRESYYVHGLSMLCLWLFAIPSGIFVNRYMKVKTWSISAHRFLVTIGGYGTISFALGSLGASSFQNLTTHGIIGVFIAFSVGLQFVLGYWTYHVRQMDSYQGNRIYVSKKSHMIFGILLGSFGLYNSRRGIHRLFVGTVYHSAAHILFDIWCWVLFVIFTSSEIFILYQDYQEKSDHMTVKEWITDEFLRTFHSQKWDNESQASFNGYMIPPNLRNSLLVVSRADVCDRIGTGCLWIIINDLVFDVRDWVDSHPGGRALILDSIGSDITKKFKYGLHRHSIIAWKALLTFAIARLDQSHRGSISSPRHHRSSLVLDGNKVVPLATVRTSDLQYDFLKLKEKRKLTSSKTVPLYEFIFEPSSNFSMKTVSPGLVYVFHIILRQSSNAVIERKYSPTYIDDDNKVHFLIKLYKNGVMSQYLQKMKPQDKLKVRPYHDQAIMCLNPIKKGLWNNFAMICCGSGITPMIQLINYHAMGCQLDPTFKCNMKLFFLESRESNLINVWDHLDTEGIEYSLVVKQSLSNPPKDWVGYESIDIEILFDFLDIPSTRSLSMEEKDCNVSFDQNEYLSSGDMLSLSPKECDSYDRIFICGRRDFVNDVILMLRSVGFDQGQLVPLN